MPSIETYLRYVCNKKHSLYRIGFSTILSVRQLLEAMESIPADREGLAVFSEESRGQHEAAVGMGPGCGSRDGTLST